MGNSIPTINIQKRLPGVNLLIGLKHSDSARGYQALRRNKGNRKKPLIFLLEGLGLVLAICSGGGFKTKSRLGRVYAEFVLCYIINLGVQEGGILISSNSALKFSFLHINRIFLGKKAKITAGERRFLRFIYRS